MEREKLTICVVNTFVTVTVYPQYSNVIIKKEIIDLMVPAIDCFVRQT
jgi:hypothetical protein